MTLQEDGFTQDTGNYQYGEGAPPFILKVENAVTLWIVAATPTTKHSGRTNPS